MQNKFQTHFSRDIARYSVLHAQRKATNKVVGFIFAFSFLLWIFVIWIGMRLPTQITNSAALDYSQLDSGRILKICGFILLSVTFTLIAFTLMGWVPRVTRITLAIFWIPVPCSILIVHHLIPLVSEKFVSTILVQVVASILTCIFVIILLSTEWFHMPEKVLKEACKMTVDVPSTLLFALYSSLLTVFLTVVLIIVTVKLCLFDATYTQVALIFMNLIFGSWTITTLSTLHMMTLNGTFAEYYWVERKNNVSFRTILQLFRINLRYHIGTAAMHYPLLGGISALIYLVKQTRSLLSTGAGNTVKLFYVYNVFDAILVRIILLGGAATCSIKGKNFYESMTYTMALYMNNPRRVLVVYKVLDIVLTFMIGLVMFSTSFSTFLYVDIGFSRDDSLIDFINSWRMKFWVLVMMGGATIVATYIQCICAASCSIMLSLQEEVVQLGNALPQDSYAMSRDLHSVLQHDGPPQCFCKLCSCCISNIRSHSYY